MRNLMLLSILFFCQQVNAQVAQAVSTTYDYSIIEAVLANRHTEENMHELIDAVHLLPVDVFTSESESEEWLAARKRNVEIYLKWYDKMFTAGFKLGERAIIGAKSKRSQQKNESVKSFLIAEQRLKQFMKSSFKGRKKNELKKEIQGFGESYDTVAYQIMREVLNPEFGFVIYDKSVKVD